MLTKWLGHEFESSSYTTDEFARFSIAMRATIKAELAPEFDLVTYNRGHFYFSAFFRNKSNGKLVYISSSDVRYFPNSWAKNLLIRSAEHEKDYRGGPNNYSELATLKTKAHYLTK